MTKTQKALERVIIELDSWCDNWTPTSYNDPRISLRQIADRARDVLDPRKKMTEFQPTPQTPEQVDEGLRNAFRQAKEDGVMDATPYLNQMTFNTDIEKTEAEIKVLQKKLELLKEIETHKSQPRMTLQFNVKGEVVSYNDEVYYRLEFTDGSHGWYKKKHTVDGLVMVAITDGETRRLLEGLWFNEVKKGKYDEPYCPDEPEHYDEVEWDEKDNPKTLYDMLTEFSSSVNKNYICEIVSEWLPDEDDGDDRYACGWNDCLEKLKLRLK